MPIPTTDEQRAAAAAVSAWAGRATPVQTTRAQETTPDGWRKHWPDLAGLGLFGVAVPPSAGGAGGTVADLAAMVEAAAEALTPGPVLPTALAALLLGRAEEPRPLLAELLDGTLTGAVALSGVLGARRAGDELVLDGSVTPVLGAESGGVVVVPVELDGKASWIVLGPLDGHQVHELAPADFSRSIGTVHCAGVRVPASRLLAGTDSATVEGLAAVLCAAEAAGVAAWSLRTAVDYAKVRDQFGAKIGSFQAIKHLCAEMLCRVEQAAAVAWDAASAASASWDAASAASGEEEGQFALAAAVAAAVAPEAAVQTAKDCIQVLGGVGFTWEHDAHLYLRRALATRQLLGGTARWRREVAELTGRGLRRELHIDLGVDGAEHRASVRETVAAIAALPVDQRRRALADAGYLAPHWPAPYGLGADAAHQLVIHQELSHAGVERPDLVIAGWAIPTILTAGTDAQRERFVGPTLRGGLVWCQLFSEPGAGSDLASLRTKATRVPGGWRLDGQKVWTSVARSADWGICLARTDPEAPKHKGISYFLVDMRSPGIDIRPLREITGEAMFNEVFLDGVVVPDDLVVGDVNDGWRLARATLVNERIAMAGGVGTDTELERVLALYDRRGRPDEAREVLGGLVAVGLSGALLDVRSTLRQLGGQDSGAQASVRKLIGVRYRQAVADAGLDLLGTAGTLAGEQVQAVLMTRCLTIAGGTTQVLLTLAAERILGLPRG